MTKKYTDELTKWVKQREASRPRQDKHLVAFLSVRTEVKEALDLGYSVKTIWEHMHEIGKIKYRYETFLKHIRRHIKEEPAPPTIQPEEKEEPQKTEPAKMAGFKFDPTPKKEELF